MNGEMMHEGLPQAWAVVVLVVGVLLVMRALWVRPAASPGTVSRQLMPGKWLANPWPQTLLRILVAMLFLLVIYAGVMGTPVAERNFATVITWNLWWGGLIVLVLFAGTLWCGICPWDSLAQWLVRRRLWQRGSASSSLDLQVPAWMRNVWPAAVMFTGLTWLELGYGVTRSPYATAMLALLMLVMATVFMAVFERKAFCRYVCPVGRTLGVYSQLSPVELRPVNADTCSSCNTLECYHGSELIEPCPTRLVMGRFKQNTYCTTCGACVRSCPHQNVGWHVREMASEIKLQSRPHTDEAVFILVLLALTSFHGLSMMAFWEQGISGLARVIGDSGSLLWSFSLAMTGFVLLVAFWFYLAARVTSIILPDVLRTSLYSRLAFVMVPLAFSYHLAHNVSHLARESRGAAEAWFNPAGRNTLPLSSHELHARLMNPVISENWIHILQAGLMIFGIYFAVEILRHRMHDLYLQESTVPGIRLLPMLVFLSGVTMFNMWLLMEPMVMRF